MERKPIFPRDIKRNDESLLTALDRAKLKATTMCNQLESVNDLYRQLLRTHTLLKSALHEQNEKLLAQNALLREEIARLNGLLPPKVENPPKAGLPPSKVPTADDLENG